MRCRIEARNFVRALTLLVIVGCTGCERGANDAGEANSPAAGASGGAVSRADGNANAPAGEIDERIAAIPSEPATEQVDPEAVGAIVTCVVCHGQNGEGKSALQTPRIGGLLASYIARQLHHFKTGVRAATDADEHGTQMRAIALTLANEEVMADLAAYFAALEPPYAPPSIEGDAEHGQELYAVCAACHGMDARGSEELNTPSLVGQHGWYLVRQLENFRDGVRGTHPADIYGMQMTPIVRGTLRSDSDIADVVAYIESLPQLEGSATDQPADTQEGIDALRTP